jgi:hypothetical protein
VLTGRTVHIVPSIGGNWQVVDLNRHIQTFPSRASAVREAKAVAASNQPSQVVLFDENGRFVPLAHYQLPQYRRDSNGGSALAEAAVKTLVMRSLVAAGAKVAPGLLDSVDRDLKRETGKEKASAKRKRSPSR